MPKNDNIWDLLKEHEGHPNVNFSFPPTTIQNKYKNLVIRFATYVFDEIKKEGGIIGEEAPSFNQEKPKEFSKTFSGKLLSNFAALVVSSIALRNDFFSQYAFDFGQLAKDKINAQAKLPSFALLMNNTHTFSFTHFMLMNYLVNDPNGKSRLKSTMRMDEAFLLMLQSFLLHYVKDVFTLDEKKLIYNMAIEFFQLQEINNLMTYGFAKWFEDDPYLQFLQYFYTDSKDQFLKDVGLVQMFKIKNDEKEQIAIPIRTFLNENEWFLVNQKNHIKIINNWDQIPGLVPVQKGFVNTILRIPEPIIVENAKDFLVKMNRIKEPQAKSLLFSLYKIGIITLNSS